MATYSPEQIWQRLYQEALQISESEPLLQDFLQQTILQHSSLNNCLATILASKLHNNFLTYEELLSVFKDTLQPHETQQALSNDLMAVYNRDSACQSYYQALCFYKGFHAISAYRAAHALWVKDQKQFAYLLQNRISVVMQVDIHPAAQMGSGIMFDHATGIVIGETATVGNNVSIMQSVTLGGTGKESGDRHPKIRDGVLISVGAKILGNIEVGEGAQVAAGSVVLKAVAPHTIVAGVPAKEVGKPCGEQPALLMEHKI